MIKARFDRDAFRKLGLLEEQMRQAVFGANVDLFNSLVDPDSPFKTPRDTGFAAASWFAQVDGQGGNPDAPEKGKPNPTPSPDLQVLAASVGRVLNIVNNAAYIGKLEEGHSPQNQGFVAGAANAYEDFLQARVAEVKGTGGSG